MTGTFALTFDTELIWGSFDSTSPADFERKFPDVRGTIREILRLLDQYEVTATWAIVGHLFLAACEPDANGRTHPEIVRPGQHWRPGDWYSADPGTDRARDPLWYGDDLVDAIMSTATAQEIGCHSFAHPLYGDPGMTAAAAEADLQACIDIATARGITLRSFVFPRNVEGHHEVLKARGFRAYRGADPTWHRSVPGPVGRVAHLLDHAAGVAPPVSDPSETLPGLWNIPGSALLIHRTGARSLIPRSARRRKAREGLRRAASTGGVFHLWTHPFNVASDAPYLLAVLDDVLREAATARDRGELRIESMAMIADRAARAAHGDPTP